MLRYLKIKTDLKTCTNCVARIKQVKYIVCGAWENCDNILSLMQTHNPDVVLMDIDMPGTNGLQGLEIIQKKFAEINVIMLTVFEDDENVFNSLCLGAHGYLLKRTPPEKIIDAIKEVHAGGSPMTASIARKVCAIF
jgi:DNA-binding NarL/FixJ family response regulator